MDELLTAFDNWVQKTEWMEQALCREIDTEMFYPEPMVVAHDAKRICMMCDVRLECLAYALDNDEQHGIWGGTALWERRALQKQNKKRKM